MIWYQTLVGPMCRPPVVHLPGVEYKVCIHCGEDKEITDYRIHARTGRPRNVCRKCHNKQQYESGKRR